MACAKDVDADPRDVVAREIAKVGCVLPPDPTVIAPQHPGRLAWWNDRAFAAIKAYLEGCGNKRVRDAVSKYVTRAVDTDHQYRNFTNDYYRCGVIPLAERYCMLVPRTLASSAWVQPLLTAFRKDYHEGDKHKQFIIESHWTGHFGGRDPASRFLAPRPRGRLPTLPPAKTNVNALLETTDAGLAVAWLCKHVRKLGPADDWDETLGEKVNAIHKAADRAAVFRLLRELGVVDRVQLPATAADRRAALDQLVANNLADNNGMLQCDRLRMIKRPRDAVEEPRRAKRQRTRQDDSGDGGGGGGSPGVSPRVEERIQPRPKKAPPPSG